jgi:uncharacterized Zn finger protein
MKKEEIIQCPYCFNWSAEKVQKVLLPSGYTSKNWWLAKCHKCGKTFYAHKKYRGGLW